MSDLPSLSPTLSRPERAGAESDARGVCLWLEMLGDKWRAPLLLALRGQTLRYGELSRRVEPISRTMLTRTLRDLERGGLVNRKVFAVVPSRVEYWLTPLGETFAEQVLAINVWALSHESDLLATRSNLKRPPRAK